VIYSKPTEKTLNFLGKLIKIARAQQKMPQTELAKRLNVSRQTIIAIEKGSPKVNIGTILEAAYVLGIPLLSDDSTLINKWQSVLIGFESILPTRIVNQDKEVNDDF